MFLRCEFLLFHHFWPGILVVWVSTADIHGVTSTCVDAGLDIHRHFVFHINISTYNEGNSLLLLYGAEDDITVDHDAIEVAVDFRDALHGTGASYEGLSRGETVGVLQLERLGLLCVGTGDLRTEGGGGDEVGRNLLSKVLVDILLRRVYWGYSCGLPGIVLWSGIASN